MNYKFLFFSVLIILFCITSTAFGATYFADITGGNDSYDGFSTTTPWKTINKINSSIFQPGDNILFKRGETWHEQLVVPSSGTDGNPIVFGVYGTGNNPVLSGRGVVPYSNIASSWTQLSGNVWYIYYGPWKIAKRLWLSGKEYVKPQVPADISETYPWFFDGNTAFLYVYAPANPSTYYSSIEESSVWAVSMVSINRKQHITLQNLDLRGGYATINIESSDRVIIEDCSFGYEAGMIGIMVQGSYASDRKTSDYGIIRRCKIDSGYTMNYYYEKAQTEDGIHFRNNVNHWQVYENEVKNWGHTAIVLIQYQPDRTVNYNKVYSNLITAPDISYGRGLSCAGWAGGCSYNEFYLNVIRNTTVPNQIGGDHNSVYYNIIDTVKNTNVQDKFSQGGSGLVLTPMTPPAEYSANKYVCNYNKFYNNVIYNCDGEGIKVKGWTNGYSIKYNEIKNNIILNCGNDSRVGRQGIGLYINAAANDWDVYSYTATDNVFENNLVYKAGITKPVLFNETTMSVYEFNAKTGTNNQTIYANIQMDPAFTNPVNHDFTLSNLSPCIDAGTEVGLTRDFAGTLIPLGRAVDIGAYEYPGGSYGQGVAQDSVYVWPNPLKTITGLPITFVNMPQRAIIEIFTISGEKVREIAKDSPVNFYCWDTKNSDGSAVASGVYIYMIINPEGGKKTGKIVVMR